MNIGLVWMVDSDGGIRFKIIFFIPCLLHIIAQLNFILLHTTSPIIVEDKAITIRYTFQR